MIRALLVDDHTSFRQPLAFMLGREPDIEVIGEAGTVAESRPLVEGANLALVDLDLPDGSGAEVIRLFREAQPRGVAIVLTASSRPGDLAPAVAAGAAALLHKTLPFEALIAAIRRGFAGEQLMTGREVRELLVQADRQHEEDREAQRVLGTLTRREREVLQGLAEGWSDKEIAAHLHVGNETVRTHMVNLLGKLGVTSRLQALVFAVRHGAVSLGNDG